MNRDNYRLEIEQIRRENEEEYRQEKASAFPNFIEQVFSKTGMYILEIIQNAVDAGAKKNRDSNERLYFRDIA